MSAQGELLGSCQSKTPAATDGRIGVQSKTTEATMKTRYLGMAAIAVLLGVGGRGADVSAQPYPDVERQQQQHEENVEQQHDRKAQQHRADQEQQREWHERKTERHEEKVRHQKEGSTEHAK